MGEILSCFKYKINTVGTEPTRVICKQLDNCGKMLMFNCLNAMLTGLKTYKNVIGMVLTLGSTTESNNKSGTKLEKCNPTDFYLVDKSTVAG